MPAMALQHQLGSFRVPVGSAASTRSAAVASTSARLNTWDQRVDVAEALRAAAQQQAAPVLPKLQPIGSVLARQLQREQQQRKRLCRQLHRLERQLQRANSSSSGSSISQAADIVAWEEVGLEVADSTTVEEDPLFSSSTPPSVQQLQRLLVHRRSQLLQATSSSISDVARVAQQLQDISAHLGLDLDTVIPLVARHEPLLLQPAHRLPARLSLLSSALQLPPRAAAELVSTAAPQLLGTSLTKLQTNLLQLGRVLGSRGLKPAEVLQARPDLLTQKPRSVEAKLEQLPGALGMPRQRVRQLVSQCPDLLRHSVATVSHRYHSLRQLFSIPDSFVEEFVVQEPDLLCMSATVLKAKFDSLLRRYGAFADDVLDMVLVDPALLMNADPAAAPPAPTVKASRKKQQRLALEQQQQQVQAAAAVSIDQTMVDTAQAALQEAAPLRASDAEHQAAGQQEQAEPDDETAAAADAQAQQQRWQRHEGEEEPWQTVLRLRLERRQAARERRQQRRQQQGGGEQQQQQQQQQLPGQLQLSSSSRQSPVRRLLGFAAATGLRPEQALQLWLQEPSLSQLPAAGVARQVAELSHALGLEAGSSRSAAGASSSSSSSSGDVGKPVLQLLVKEPMLLALSQQQLLENMQGLCDLLGLQAASKLPAAAAAVGQSAAGSLLPLLWEQPGLLLLPPEIGEYRLQHLAGLLQLSVPRTLALVLQQPALLTERPVLLAARLGSLCTLLGVARGVAAECVLREPRLLCVGEEELTGRWEQLVGRFSGWAPDALDVVMADPAALMRDGSGDER